MTGNIYGEVKTIETRATELQEIHYKFLLTGTARYPPYHIPSNAGQEHFLRIGLKRDKVFAALWSGERRNGNESSDDIALMNKLAYWCNADPDAMIRAFLQSPYYEQKDEPHKKKCQRFDYLPNTAKDSCATVYSTAAADYERWN